MESIISFHEQNTASFGKSTTYAVGEGTNTYLALGKRFKTFQSVNHAIQSFCDENFQPFSIQRSTVFDPNSRYYHYKSIIFSCVLSGISKEGLEGIHPTHGILRTGCPAVIKVRLCDKPCLHYKIYHLNLTHNHEISAHRYSLFSKKHCLTKEDKDFIFEIMASNATNKDIKLFIQNAMNLKLTTRDINNLQAQFKKSMNGTVENGEQITYCKAAFSEKWNMLQKKNNNPKFLKIYKQLDDLYFGISNAECISQHSLNANLSKKSSDCSKIFNKETSENVHFKPISASSLPKITKKMNLSAMNASQKNFLAKLYTDKLAILLSECNNQELETKLKILSSLIQAWDSKKNVLLSKSKNDILDIYIENQNASSKEDNTNNSEDFINSSDEDYINNSKNNAEINVSLSPRQNADIGVAFSAEQCDVVSSPEQCDVVSSPEQCDVVSSPEQCDVVSSPEQCDDVVSYPEQCGDVVSSPEQCDDIVSSSEECDDIVSSTEECDDIVSSPKQSELSTYETVLRQNLPLDKNIETFLTDESSDISLDFMEKPEFEENSPCKKLQISSMDEASCEFETSFHKILPHVQGDDSSTSLAQSGDIDVLQNGAQNNTSSQNIVTSSESISFPETKMADHISPVLLTPFKSGFQNTNPLYRIRRLFKKILPKSEDTADLRTNYFSKKKKKFRKRVHRPSKIAMPNNLRKILPKGGSSSMQEKNDASTIENTTIPQSAELSQIPEQSEECIDIFHNSSTNTVLPTGSSSSNELQTFGQQVSNLKESETSLRPADENVYSDLFEVETDYDSSNQMLNSPQLVDNDALLDSMSPDEPLRKVQKLTKSKQSKHKDVLDSSTDASKQTKRVHHKRLKPSAKDKSKKTFTLPDLSRNILSISQFKDKITQLRIKTKRKKIEHLTNNLSDADIEDILCENNLNDKIINIGQILIQLQFPEACGLQDVLLGSTLSFKVVTSKFVQIIYCKESAHWITISTLTSPSDTVYVYDSLDETVPRDAVLQICNIMNVQSPTLTIISQPMQTASNITDCGLFALASALTLLNEKDPSETIYDTSAFRQHLMSGVIKKDLQEFPSLSYGNVTKSVKRTEAFELYCLCRQPLLTNDSEAVLEQVYQCQICKNMFHLHCKPECCNVAPSPSTSSSI